MKSITLWCFSCCWAVLILSQGLVGSHSALPEKAAGAQGAGRDTARTTDQRDVPYHVAWWWTIKLRVLAGGLLCSGTGWAPLTALWTACFECLWTLLLHFSNMKIYYCIFPSFSVLSSCLYPHSWVLPFLPSQGWAVSEWTDGAELPAGLNRSTGELF